MSGLRAVIYCRISVDSEADGLGVERQEKLVRELCGDRGWTVEHVYVDNDASATSNKPRPAYLQLLADIADDTFDVIVAIDSDRLLRKPGELEALFTICEKHRKRVAYEFGGFDPVTGEGMYEARVSAARDAEEVRKLKKRVNRKHKDLAERGKLPGGMNNRPFGFDVVRDAAGHTVTLAINEPEAAEIRSAVSRILHNSESMNSVREDWNTRGVLTTTGKPWAKTSIRRVLSRPLTAGLRVYTDPTSGEQTTFDAVWPGIISRDDYVRVNELLSRRTPQRQPRRYLLTGGLLVCGKCGARLTGHPRGDGERVYSCTGPKCYLKTLVDDCDAEVLAQVKSVLDLAALRSEVHDRSADGDPRTAALEAELASVRGVIQKLDDDWYAVDTGMERHEYVTRRRALKDDESRISTRRDQLARVQGRIVLPDDGESFDDWWAHATLDQRRAFVAEIVEQVTLNPAVHGKNKFDPSRVVITWRR